MFSEYAPGVRVLEHGGHGDPAQRPLEVATALADDLFAERDPLADFDGQRGTSGLSDPAALTRTVEA